MGGRSSDWTARWEVDSLINDWIIEQVVVWVARTRVWGMDSWLDGWVDQ